MARGGVADGRRSSTTTLTPDALVALMTDAEDEERRAMRRLRLPRRHSSRATDALHVLRALSDPATGAPVAAPTTSLPEAPGGERQFDYRFSWLRDSALGLGTAVMLGHLDAGARYLDFVAGLLDRYDGHLQPLSTTSGDRVPPEREIAGVAGWAASRPVRVGNAAGEQRQLDALATIIDATWTYTNNGGRMNATPLGGGRHAGGHARRCPVRADERRLGAAPAGRASSARRSPAGRDWTGRCACAAADDRGCDVPRGGTLARWRAVAWRRRSTRRRACSRSRSSRVTRLPTRRRSTSPSPGSGPRRDRRAHRLVTATVAALEEGPFLRRYPPADDGFAGTEGAFLPASWWAVTALAAVGELDAAWARADALCALLPPLQPEEWDVERGEALGNTPLLWSHTEAARCLYFLQRADVRRRFGPLGLRLWAVTGTSACASDAHRTVTDIWGRIVATSDTDLPQKAVDCQSSRR